MIHLAGPVVLSAALAGAGVYGLLARRNVVLVLIGAELLLNAVNVLLVTAGSLPATGLAGLTSGAAATDPAMATDPLLPGPVLTIMVITIAAAEIGLALAIVLLVFRERSTSDLTALRELGESGPTYDGHPESGELSEEAAAAIASSAANGAGPVAALPAATAPERAAQPTGASR